MNVVSFAQQTLFEAKNGCYMNEIADNIADEFETVTFGDKRIDKRAKKILRDIYFHVGSGLSGSCQGADEIKAGYRYFDNPKVTMQKILAPHSQTTLERIREQKIVALSQDTTDADMKHMHVVADLGVLNDTDRPGCSLHPVIAFTPDQLCLGVVHNEVMIRNPNDLGKKPNKNTRAFEDKETYRWLVGYQVACEVANKCPDTLCVSIGDREYDIYEVFVEAAKPESKAELIARARHNREVLASEIGPNQEKHRVLIEENNQLERQNKELTAANRRILKNTRLADLTEQRKTELDNNKLLILQNKKKSKENIAVIDEDDKFTKSLMFQMKKAKIIGQVEFTLAEGRGRKSRLVKQNIRTATLTLPPPAGKKNLPSISINAVFLEEIDTPDGASPICWLLLTTLPVDSLDAATLVVKLYLSRWGVELFFKVLKSGCKIEKLRFQQAHRLLPCIAMYMIVAWRVMYATYLGRECPDAPCSLLFDEDEWHSVFAVVKQSSPPAAPPSLGDFTKMVATLGGYRGRKGDKPPGIKVMWTGIQAMHRLAAGWGAHRKFGKTSSSL